MCSFPYLSFTPFLSYEYIYTLYSYVCTCKFFAWTGFWTQVRRQRSNPLCHRATNCSSALSKWVLFKIWRMLIEDVLSLKNQFWGKHNGNIRMCVCKQSFMEPYNTIVAYGFSNLSPKIELSFLTYSFFNEAFGFHFLSPKSIGVSLSAYPIFVVWDLNFI